MVGELIRYNVLILIPLLCWGCGKETPKTGRNTPAQPDQILEESTITFSTEGTTTAVIYADRISKYLKGGEDILQGVRTKFYDREGKLSSILTSQEGVVRGGKEEIEARGKVVVVTSEGLRLETPSLKWNSRTNRIYTDSLVKISRGGNVVTGKGMEADPELKQIKIRSEIKGRIKGLHIDEGL